MIFEQEHSLPANRNLAAAVEGPDRYDCLLQGGHAQQDSLHQD